MAGYSEPETFNSQGLVRNGHSFDSSQANLFSQPGSDCSLDSSVENYVPRLFLAMSNGLHPALATEMFHSSMNTPKQLSQYLTIIFSHGLKTGQVSMSLLLARQFHSYMHYTMAIVNSMSVMVTQARLDTIHLASLLSSVYKELGSAKDCMTPLLVDTLVRWGTPSMDKRRELLQAKGAKQIIQQAGPALSVSSVASYRLVFMQIRSGLVGGGMGAETRAVLLDMMVIMGRQVMQGEEGSRFAVDRLEEEGESLKEQNCVAKLKEDLMKESVVSDSEDNYCLDSVERVENIIVGQEVEEVKDSLGLDSEYVCSFATDIEKIKAAKKTSTAGEDHPRLVTLDTQYQTQRGTGQVQLVTPAMFEEVACQALQKPAGQVKIVPSEVKQTLLGHLVSSDLGTSFPVSDQCTIGRVSSCSIMLEGREVSRLHARVLLREGEVIMESVGTTNQVRINGKMIPSGQMVTLNEEDRVQVGRDVLVWHREGGKQMEEISQGSSWGEKDSSADIALEEHDDDEGEVFEDNVVANDHSTEQPSYDYSNQVETTASSDTDSVVVEMVNFIQ